MPKTSFNKDKEPNQFKPQLKAVSGDFKQFGPFPANDIHFHLKAIIESAELLKKDSLEAYERSKLVCKIINSARTALHFLDETFRDRNLESSESNSVINKYSGPNTVLVIDDEEVIRNIAKSILELCGYEVILAESGKAGIEMFQRYQEKIDCVLLDITMPFFPGNLIYAKLKAINPDIKIFLMSGLGEKNARLEFESEQIAGIIKKPFTIDALMKSLHAASGQELH